MKGTKIMIDCDRARTQWNDFLDGTLGAAQSAELMAHLHECGDCREEYHALEATRKLLRHAAVPDSAGARDRVLARFRHTVGAQAEPQRLRIAWWRRPVPLGMTALTAAACLLLTFMTMNRIDVPTTESDLPSVVVHDSLLPSNGDMDHMVAQHAAQSDDVLNGDDVLHHDALADANARLEPASWESE